MKAKALDVGTESVTACCHSDKQSQLDKHHLSVKKANVGRMNSDESPSF